ncbi:MAG: hypothetical protein KGJ13_01465 [Patescibacteria group bacterium]|nr:hypothetical protein [Patescibacteria group bacterium]
MKKLLVSIFLSLALMSFGSIALAHAQTAPADQATLQQQLQLMKAKLQLLELQQGQDLGAAAESPVTAAITPAAQPAATDISAADAAALNAALSSLATTLVSLQNAMQSNPQFLAENGPVIAKSLSGIENSLAAVLISMQNGTGSALAQNETPAASAGQAPLVAVNNPSPSAAPAARNGSEGLNSGSLLPSVQDLTQPAQNQPAAQGAAVASSIFGGNRLPAIIIGVILLAMIAILIWGRGGNEEPAAVSAKSSKKPAPAPVAPVQPTISFVSNHAPAPNASTATASPLANALNHQQQRKSA